MCLQTALLLGTCDPGIDFREGTLRQSLSSCSLAKAFIYQVMTTSSESSLESPPSKKKKPQGSPIHPDATDIDSI